MPKPVQKSNLYFIASHSTIEPAPGCEASKFVTLGDLLGLVACEVGYLDFRKKSEVLPVFVAQTKPPFHTAGGWIYCNDTIFRA